MSEIKLRKWQEAVEDWFSEYDAYVGSEMMQSLQQYDINKKSSLNIKMADGAGHTFLTSYLSSVLPLKHGTPPVVVIYFDVEHLKVIESAQKDICNSSPSETISTNQIFMSVFELYYAINESAHGVSSSNLQRIKTKINGNVVIVDNASELPNNVRDFILTVATNAVVFLG